MLLPILKFKIVTEINVLHIYIYFKFLQKLLFVPLNLCLSLFLLCISHISRTQWTDFSSFLEWALKPHMLRKVQRQCMEDTKKLALHNRNAFPAIKAGKPAFRLGTGINRGCSQGCLERIMQVFVQENKKAKKLWMELVSGRQANSKGARWSVPFAKEMRQMIHQGMWQ